MGSSEVGLDGGGRLIGIVQILVSGFVFLGFAAGAVVTGGLIWLGSRRACRSSLPVFALVSLGVWLAMRRVFGLSQASVKVWDRDINDN